MRDSALKLAQLGCGLLDRIGRRRAHARQRFETISWNDAASHAYAVGEELMRDSALKPGDRTFKVTGVNSVGEELMRDSALKHLPYLLPRYTSTQSEKSSCATAL